MAVCSKHDVPGEVCWCCEAEKNAAAADGKPVMEQVAEVLAATPIDEKSMPAPAPVAVADPTEKTIEQRFRELWAEIQDFRLDLAHISERVTFLEHDAPSPVVEPVAPVAVAEPVAAPVVEPATVPAPEVTEVVGAAV